MKSICSLVVGIVLLLALNPAVQAGPPTGIWETPTHFLPGTWLEKLHGGEEGQPGNEITAASESYYEFKGALLEKVKEITSPGCAGRAFETTYLEGTLELTTGILPVSPAPMAPWYISPGADPYIIDLGETIVTTCKYSKVEMSFILKSGGIFRNPAYPKYIAEITAEYSRGTPTRNDGVLPAISDSLSSARIIITGIAGVDIKPGSCPNPINTKSRGVIPAAILGGPDFDVKKIAKGSIFLTNGDEAETASGVVEVYPIRLAFEEDVATPFEYDPFLPREDRLDCHQWGYDGYKDLTLKFDTQEVVSAFGLSTEDDRSIQEWFLMFKLTDGNELTGSDLVWILNRTQNRNNGNHYGRTRHKGY